MKQRSIPAQITTVEDRIAGNLNFTQIVLLILPIFWVMIVYAVLPKPMHLSLYKIPFIIVVSLLCGVLALRIKEKVLLHWLLILLTYYSRPMYYLYDKNDKHLRDIILPVAKKKHKKQLAKAKALAGEENGSPVSLPDLVRLEGLIANPNISLSIQTSRKGGLNVAIKKH